MSAKKELTSRELFDKNPWQWWQSHAEDTAELMRGESPRGAAVLARGYMETVLEEFLLRHALKNTTKRKQLAQAVAFGLEQKIGICKKLHLVKEPALSYMNLIRLIGDRFAHRPELRDCDDDDVVWSNFEKLHGMMPASPPQELKSEWALALLGTALRHVILHLGDVPLDTVPYPAESFQ
jgi:hypothetical protein